MKADRWKRVADLFDRVIELPKEQRSRFLQEECEDEPSLIKIVLSLVESDEETLAFMAGPLTDSDPEESLPERAQGERWIGQFRVLEELGEGGMSTVFRAQQEGVVRRTVALKLIRRGMESAETRRRLQIERQILAGLEHPNIARLYDGGMTEEGLPYFAMELVEGSPIDEYCDRERLSIEARLELFQKICAAVRYAHQNLVVHRDIKPSNILVTGEGEPKLLDFGIAKLLDPEAGLRTEPTVAWMRLLTPQYASPEQIRGDKVTTACDVYSLGMLLYKLLAGRLPFGHRGLSLEELEERAKESSAAPSTSLAELANGPGENREELEKIAENRGLGPEQLRKALSGDLDTIVLKATHLEPKRRFLSPEHFSEDIRRYLDDRPVLARPDTFGYRATKYLRRNWLPVATAALFVLLLAGSTIALAVQSGRIRLERDQLEEVVAFVIDVFNVAGESEKLTVKQAVDRSATLLEHKLVEQPAVQGTLRNTLGQIYLNLGEPPRAREQLERAVELRRAQQGSRSLAVAESLSSLGLALTFNGDFDDGEARAREALDLYQDRFGPQHPKVIPPLNNLVSILCYKDENGEEVHRLAETALDLARKVLPADHRALGDALAHRALLESRDGRLAEASQLYQQTLDLYRRALGEEHPDIAVILNNLAKNAERQGDLERAESLYRETVALQRKLLGNESSTLAQGINNLALLLEVRGDFDEAVTLFGEAVSIVEKIYGKGDYASAITVGGLAGALIGRGDAEEAEALLLERLAGWRGNLEGSWFLAYGEGMLGEALLAQNRLAEAEPLLEAGYLGLQEGQGENSPRTRRALANLIELYEAWGKSDLAHQYRSRQ